MEQDLVFAGLIGMIDPPRAEAKEAVARAQGAGIRPIMITGDHPATAAVIAAELGIAADGRAVTGAELEQMTDEALDANGRATSRSMRASIPSTSCASSRRCSASGAIVAMTGDGVNDAPALKTADIGVAMGITGTDVSKEAADMVLADDNFASIVAAVEEGRAIFANIRKFLRYLLSSNIGEVLTMFFGVLLADRIGLRAEGERVVLPLLATQILWINLVTDGAPALALGVDPADAGLMQPAAAPARRARDHAPHVARNRLRRGGHGRRHAVGARRVAARRARSRAPGDLRYAQTMAFTTLMLFQLFNVFNARSDERSAFVGLFTNRWLWAAIGLSLALAGLVVYVPALQQAFGTDRLERGETGCAASRSPAGPLVAGAEQGHRAVEEPRVALE